MSENATFPGDKIASIEEYEAGNNTFDDGDMVRAATVGEKRQSSKNAIHSKSRRYYYWNSCSSNVINDCSIN
jgi:exosome complex RNA-binding protein Csl4